jgi:hypothetical protein
VKPSRRRYHIGMVLISSSIDNLFYDCFEARAAFLSLGRGLSWIDSWIPAPAAKFQFPIAILNVPFKVSFPIPGVQFVYFSFIFIFILYLYERQ